MSRLAELLPYTRVQECLPGNLPDTAASESFSGRIVYFTQCSLRFIMRDVKLLISGLTLR